ncbi:hypothetical protein [Xenorhabdus szentirmaii]|uniref:Uncharacterized protein n=1 Tax=Xenorhabdus szentirmaii DSM 16338 TaxID=1427518 RepID=W1J5Q3_9GAMM|nr:hypothetical protein [Xenorhabdus szentirmaii]PHM31979.1 hypothetical protein Xsze_02707 [Xenorhabdus szentirmaii DSM 16338]CDL85383.1 conserved hypothetical protein [Xenorhabdus szentirmaii DSM 16338]
MSDGVLKIGIPIIISIFSMIFSGMAWWQSKEQTKLQELNYEKSTEPHITIVPSNDSKKGENGFYLFNGGLSTGYIEDIKIKINDEVINMPESYFDVANILTDYFGLSNPINCIKYGIPRKGDPIILNEMIPFWVASGKEFNCTHDHLKLFNMMFSKDTNLDIILTYKSVYGVSYQYSSKLNLKTRL